MTEVLDTIDKSLQEVEEQLLQEFDRIRNTISDARFEAIDLGIKTALSSVVDELKDRLEKTGDASNLQLMTEQHEVLLARMAVLRQLLNAKVPTAFLHEAHNEVVSNRKKLEAKVETQRRKVEIRPDSEAEAEAGKSGLVNKLKGMFGGGNQSDSANSRNTIRVTEAEQKALEPVNIYLDNGIYSASRELAALANVFSLPEQQREALQDTHEKKMRAVISGKAQFESRDLSDQAPEARDGKDIAQTPEQIRRKLAERSSSQTSGASSFQSRDLSAGAPSTSSKPIAQTPEEIRRKLAARSGGDAGKASFSSRDISHEEAVEQPGTTRTLSAAELAAQRKAELEKEKAQQPTTGKASFISKDIDPIVPQEVRQTRKKVEAEESDTTPEPPKSGKAIFESRELSNPPPKNKR